MYSVTSGYTKVPIPAAPPRIPDPMNGQRQFLVRTSLVTVARLPSAARGPDAMSSGRRAAYAWCSRVVR